MVVDEEIMCSDIPIREKADYKSITVLTKCAGPVVIMARTYKALREDVNLFFANSFDVRDKTSRIKTMQADHGIMRQIAERG